jgi:hypothetical protein
MISRAESSDANLMDLSNRFAAQPCAGKARNWVLL